MIEGQAAGEEPDTTEVGTAGDEAVAAGGVPPAEAESVSVAEAHRAILEDPRYQFTPSEPPPPPEPSWLDRLLNRLFGSDAATAIFEILGTLLEWAFWIGLALLAAFVVFQAGKALWTWFRARRGKPDEEEATPYVPAEKTAKTLLEDARRLASEGRYGEAVRLILRRSIEDMERQFPGRLRDAMTSREIAVLPILTGEAREAFARIAQLVERAAFAGRALTQAEYEEARGIYERLTKQVRQPAKARAA